MGAETELKLAILPEYAQDVAGLALPGAGEKEPGDALELTNIYYDTPGCDLHLARSALRIRRQGAGYIQTLKSAGNGQAGLSIRNEWEWPRDEPTLDRAVLADHLPDSLTGGEGLLQTLVPVFETNFQRRIVMLEGDEAGGWRVEMAFDQGEILAGGRSEPICEIELELKRGTPDCLFQLASEIARQLPVQVLDASKAQRGYRLAGHDVHALPQVNVEFQNSEAFTLVSLVSACLKAWPPLLDAAFAGDEVALGRLVKTLDLLLVALESLPEVAEHCQVLISQYQRLRSEVARAHDWRLLSCMPAAWKTQRKQEAKAHLEGLRHKTLPGQLALATGELLWQMAEDAEGVVNER
ncbi:MAG: hypothetical protein CMI01_04680 [Oceanospirillaceae bacterium]|jgi:inorganic triphosphatase YgiF|nr:hypothetical protein [Oceanospirillaceae bacterium]